MFTGIVEEMGAVTMLEKTLAGVAEILPPLAAGNVVVAVCSERWPLLSSTTVCRRTTICRPSACIATRISTSRYRL